MNYIVPENEPCLSQEELIRYVQDECSLEDMQRIDRHLSHCVLCTDAVEGAMMTNDFESVMTNLDIKINHKVNDLSTPSSVLETTVLPLKTPIFRRNWRWIAAASLAGVTTLAVWRSLSPVSANGATADVASDSAVVAMQPPREEALPAQKTVTSTEPHKTLRSKSAPPVRTSPVPSAAPVASAPPRSASIDTVASMPAPPASISTPVSDMSNTSIASADTETKSERVNMEKESNHKASPASVEVATVELPKKRKDIAEDDYHGAANAPLSKAASPSSALSLQKAYQRAWEAYQSKDYSSSITQFNQVLGLKPAPSSDIYDNTLWYLADAYLQIGDKATAKALLERIVSEKTRRKRDAAQLLKNSF